MFFLFSKEEIKEFKFILIFNKYHIDKIHKVNLIEDVEGSFKKLIDL